MRLKRKDGIIMYLKTKADMHAVDAGRNDEIAALQTEVTELNMNLGDVFSEEWYGNLNKMQSLTVKIEKLQADSTPQEEIDALPDGETIDVSYVDSLEGRAGLIEKINAEISEAVESTETAIAEANEEIEKLRAKVENGEVAESTAKAYESKITKLEGEVDVLEAAKSEYTRVLNRRKRKSTKRSTTANSATGEPKSGPQTITVMGMEVNLSAEVVEDLKESYAKDGKIQPAVNTVLVDRGIISEDQKNHAWNSVARIVGHLTPAQAAKLNGTDDSDADADDATEKAAA